MTAQTTAGLPREVYRELYKQIIGTIKHCSTNGTGFNIQRIDAITRKINLTGPINYTELKKYVIQDILTSREGITQYGEFLWYTFMYEAHKAGKIVAIKDISRDNTRKLANYAIGILQTSGGRMTKNQLRTKLYTQHMVAWGSQIPYGFWPILDRELQVLGIHMNSSSYFLNKPKQSAPKYKQPPQETPQNTKHRDNTSNRGTVLNYVQKLFGQDGTVVANSTVELEVMDTNIDAVDLSTLKPGETLTIKARLRKVKETVTKYLAVFL